jgi:hypothetical protein
VGLEREAGAQVATILESGFFGPLRDHHRGAAAAAESVAAGVGRLDGATPRCFASPRGVDDEILCKIEPPANLSKSQQRAFSAIMVFIRDAVAAWQPREHRVVMLESESALPVSMELHFLGDCWELAATVFDLAWPNGYDCPDALLALAIFSVVAKGPTSAYYTVNFVNMIKRLRAQSRISPEMLNMMEVRVAIYWGRMWQYD